MTQPERDETLALAAFLILAGGVVLLVLMKVIL